MKNFYDMTQKQIVEALLNHPSVDDCVVLVREVDSRRELVAYIVSAGPFSVERLQSHLETTLPTVLPSAYVPVSTLPLTNLGLLDEQALTELEVIDSDLVQRWEAQLRSIPEVEQVAVVIRERQESFPPLHLSDILPKRVGVAGKIPLETDVEQSSTAAVRAVVVAQASESKALAIGEPLVEEFSHPTILSAVLRRTALQAPEKGIVYLHTDGSELFQFYKELLEEAERILAGCRQLGLKPQDRVIFQLDRNRDFIPAFWGCMLGGFVPVPISTAPTYESSNSTVQKLHSTWQMLERPLVLTSSELAPAVRSLSGTLGLENFQVATIDELRSPVPDCNWHASQPDDLAVLIFTSGSTGTPKGVMLSHRNILSNVAASTQMNGFSGEEVSLNWLHLDHVGSLIRCSIRDIYVGSQQIHAPAEAVLEDPLRWLDWIDRYRVTFAWAPNFALGLVNARAEAIGQRRWDLSAVKSILSVAEAIVPKTAQRFWELLAPHGLSVRAMHAAWGMSETCAAVAFSHSYLLDFPSADQPFVEVGAPIPGFQMRIVDEREQVVPEKTIGRLQIAGLMIAGGYYQNPTLNREAFTDDGWLRTGDLGFLHQGRLTVTGRQKDVIIINGLNHYCHEIEAVVEAVEGVEVSYTAACAIRQPDSDTDRLAIFFHTSLKDSDRPALLKEIRGNVVRQLRVNPDYLIPVDKEVIPKTAIGKIQRAQLKTRLEVGEFDSILKQVDILSANANTLPNWFHRQIWRQKEAVALTTQPKRGLCLVFLDQLGLGLRLCTQLRQSQALCVVVAGLKFAQLDSHRYQIDPKNADHYCQLLESLKATNLQIDRILHLWTYGQYEGCSLESLERAQEWGIYSLLFSIQALAQVQGTQTSVQLSVVSSYTQPTSPQDKIAYEKTPLLGLMKTIPQEMPWLDCRHIDLTAAEVEADATCVLREIQVIQQEREVAYRDGRRLVPRLERVDLRQERQQESPFKHGGMYLLSGGLGEIGVEIARYLLQHYGARLLLVGRTPLPERSTWSTHLDREDAVSKRIRAYLSLKQLGEVIYEAVDICDLDQLQQVVERAKSRWQCELDGVVHLARITQERLLIEETKDSVAAMLRPKVTGTWVLHQLLKHPNSVFVSFSSVASFFGAYSVGAYAAANRFLDCFSHYQRSQNSLRSYCFAWSIWEDVGKNRSYQMRELSRARGYYTISSQQGLNSLFAGLSGPPGQLIVGVDGSNPYMQRYTATACHHRQKLCAYFTASSARLPILDLKVRDGFGTPVACEFQQLQQMPLTAGEIDRERLAVQGHQAAERVAPTTELEHQLVSIWQKVLGVPQVGIHDNFFELGGSSLLAAQMFTQIENLCGKILPLATLFQAPTVAQLALLHQERSTPCSSLVAIQPNGSKPPLFGVHEVTGNILFYHDLARHLGLDQPFYGLQAQGVDGQRTPLTRCEDIAALYVKEIRTLQPKGPYFLAGFSMGGILAFEMAQQLHRAGQEVALLALLDTYAPLDSRQWPLGLRVSHHLRHLREFGSAYVLERLRARIQGCVPNYSTNERPLPDAPHSLTVIEANRQAVRDYTFQAYPGRVTFFRVNEPSLYEGKVLRPRLCWRKLAAGGLTVYDVPGDHESMITEPHVQVLAEKLMISLDEAQAGDRGPKTPNFSSSLFKLLTIALNRFTDNEVSRSPIASSTRAVKKEKQYSHT